MRIYLNLQEDTQTTVKNAKYLKNSKQFGKVFVVPNRNPEERMERRRLVQLLREERQKEPERHRYISRCAVCSSDHPSEHVINMRNNTSTDEGLQDLSAHFQLLD